MKDEKQKWNLAAILVVVIIIIQTCLVMASCYKTEPVISDTCPDESELPFMSYYDQCDPPAGLEIKDSTNIIMTLRAITRNCGCYTQLNITVTPVGAIDTVINAWTNSLPDLGLDPVITWAQFQDSLIWPMPGTTE